MTAIDKNFAQLAKRAGFHTGTSLENRVAYRLSRWGFGPTDVQQEYRVPPYRLDFAWPAIKVGLEADGWWHRSPEGAAKDARRDSMLRARGWLIFRVDDGCGSNGLEKQLCRVVRTVRMILDDEGP